jgi:HD-GYP domain-containing protein (c-di-GMP phosphodiesterase class II)
LPAVPTRRGRILYSLLLLLFVVGVVPLLWTSWELVARSREILELDQKSLQLDKARSLSRQVAVLVGGLRSEVGAVARTLEADAGGGGFAGRIARISAGRGLERMIGSGQIVYLSVVDPRGAGARSGVQLPESAIERLLEEGWQRGLDGRAMISHPVMSSSLQEPVIVIGEPVQLPGGGVAGAVLAVASLGPLWAMAHETSESGQVEAYVVDTRGHLIAHSDPARLGGERDLSQLEIVRLFLESRGRAGATLPFALEGPRGRSRMLGTYARVPDDSGWGVIVQTAEDEAYYTANAMRNRSLLLVALVALSAALLGSLFARQISQPIQQLARGARRLAAGEYETRVPVTARNEVGVLAEAFNHMGEEIQRAIEQVRAQAALNKELFLGSVRMLANAIDEKDPYTRGHSERVAFYSETIARHLGMEASEVERVHLAGILHDVGKIGIEDKILRKAAALTDDEYEIMKQHPSKGEHILTAVPTLKELAGAGLAHHENVDGSGYPRGLSGEEIPLLGRIVSVADAFDAMTTERPYSKAMTFEAALLRLRALAGKKFDAACVEAMDRAYAAGEVSPARARLAAIAARRAAEPVAS